MSRVGRSSLVVVIIAAGLLAGILVLRWRSQSDTSAERRQPQASVNAAPAVSAGPPKPSIPAADSQPPQQMLPGDPLPAPAVVSGNVEEQAAILARQVLSGSNATGAALVAAIRHAGFSFRSSSGTLDAPPTDRSQGIAFDTWEVNALAELMRNRKSVTVPLSSFADGLAAPLAQLADAPMTDLLLDGVRRHARESDGPMLFWAMFIVELGRQATTHQPYDLLGQVDSATTSLDALQMMLISKRLAGDVAVLAYPEHAKRNLALRLPSWALPVVYAQSGPCTFKDAQGEIVDWAALATTTGFEKLMEFLESKGVAGAGTIARLGNYANIVLAYAKLVISHLAFDIQFGMEKAPPLIRPTAMRPQAGEPKTLVATAKMDLGKVEWVNCFRIVLNAMGLDFNVDASGPIADASVSWTGISGFSEGAIYGGGPEQIVRFVNDPGSRIQSGGGIYAPNAITNQLTDKEGKARVKVEGVGQRQNLGRQPRSVMKQATAGAMLVLKPANLYRDLKDAGSTAIGGLGGLLTMPVELLYRTRWSFGGWYTFPVQDWKAGNGWTGAVSYTRIERKDSATASTGKCCGGKPTQSDSSSSFEETLQYRWEIPNNSDSAMLTPGFSMATADYTLTARSTKTVRSHHQGWSVCRGGARPQAFRSHERTDIAQADYTDQAQLTVSLETDGSFLINGGGPNRRATGTTQMTEKNDHNDGCHGQEPTRTRSLSGIYRPAMWPGNIEGTADPNTDALVGTLTRVHKHPGANTTVTHIYSWQLHR